MRKIRLENLIFKGKHGEEWAEKQIAQRFRVNAEISFDFFKASESDKLKDTINWVSLRDDIKNTIEKESFSLVEKLAEEIIKKLSSYKSVGAVKLKIDKLDAWDNGYPGVTIERTN